MIRVLLADDEDMIRTALASLLRLEDDLEVIAECSNGSAAVEAALRLKPDICLLDLEMPGLASQFAPCRLGMAYAHGDGLQAIPKRGTHPQTGEARAEVARE